MENNVDLAKWLAGEMTGSELEAFEKSPEFATYQKIKTIRVVWKLQLLILTNRIKTL